VTYQSVREVLKTATVNHGVQAKTMVIL
jgi:hypothetical protein